LCQEKVEKFGLFLRLFVLVLQLPTLLFL
jgi:hypothetical protein